VNIYAAAAAFAIVACVLFQPAAAADPVITNVHPFELHPGVNKLPGFGVNGETFTIVQAWRGNGNAHGYHVWLVMSPEAEGQPFGVTGMFVEGQTLPQDLIRDDPFDGERILGSIRFARAQIDGVAQTVLIDSFLNYDSGRPLADHETARIRMFKLVRSEDGGQPDMFVEISEMQTTKRYCSVEYAVRDVLHIGGENLSGADGCS
jgi:hypothetical protein